MTRLMYDSTNVADDPLAAQLVAYYVDGAFAVAEATVRARFPNAVLVPISAVGTNNGLVGDVEPGCMSYAEGVTWVKERRAAGVDPTIYCNQMHDWIPLKDLFAKDGMAEPHWWVADYDAVAVVPPGAVAKQYENPTLDHGHFDLSVALDFWPGVDDYAGAGQGNITAGGNQMFLEPPFEIKTHAGCVWYDAPGGKVVSTAPGLGSTYSVHAVSPDGLWYEIATPINPNGTWWFKASSVGVVIGELDADLTLDQVKSVIASEQQNVQPAAVPTLWQVLSKTFAGK